LKYIENKNNQRVSQILQPLHKRTKKKCLSLKKDTSNEVLKNEKEEDTEKEWLLNTGYVLSQKEELLLI
jgi:hypothetical protein